MLYEVYDIEILVVKNCFFGWLTYILNIFLQTNKRRKKMDLGMGRKRLVPQIWCSSEQ